MEIFEFSTIQMRNGIRRGMLQAGQNPLELYSKSALKRLFRRAITLIDVLVVSNVVLWVGAIIYLMCNS